MCRQMDNPKIMPSSWPLRSRRHNEMFRGWYLLKFTPRQSDWKVLLQAVVMCGSTHNARVKRGVLVTLQENLTRLDGQVNK